MQTIKAAIMEVEIESWAWLVAHAAQTAAINTPIGRSLASHAIRVIRALLGGF